MYETALLIRQLGLTHNTVAFTDTLCASAGYWLASQCHRITCTYSATVGSIGVYTAWYDETKRLEKEGITLVAFYAGKYKISGIDGRELTKDEKELFQTGVDKCYADFVSAVRFLRPEIPDSSLQGQCFDSGDDAVIAGIVDEVVADFDEVVASLTYTE